MKGAPQHIKILGIYPCSKGIAYAVLEARGVPLSWGVLRLYSGHMDELRCRLDALIQRHPVQVLCVEQLAGALRGERAKRLIRTAMDFALSVKCDVVEVSQKQLRSAVGLGEQELRYEVAKKICSLLPDLEDLLPPERKAWQPENERISVLFAAGLAVGGSGKSM